MLIQSGMLPGSAQVVFSVFWNEMAVAAMITLNCVLLKLGKKNLCLLFLFGAVVGKVEQSEEICHPSDIFSLDVYSNLDKGIFSIDKNVIILVPHAHDAFLNITGQPKIIFLCYLPSSILLI
ncbi:hypothetical protein VP01_722g3 [Puccinia sorghi]|uniref:Uncharacterized protein n=1 Tax=Puccinia sorghi TaxID=27349 RepID=A0A0L6UE17_9BASI|nr:hypothetical protein VP01_722g3 [Puccinia sorghi]